MKPRPSQRVKEPDRRHRTTRLDEQRRLRLVASARARDRLEIVIRLVASAYHLQVRWLPEDGAEGAAALDRETQWIAARLALARQIPLVIGDPVRRILWLARQPFDLMLQRARSGTTVLEPLAKGVQSTVRRTEEGASTPVERLLRVCGPAASALVVQSEALLALAPQIATCPTHRRHLRYVLAAPHNICRLHGELLTSWRERLLCLPIGQDDRLDERVASVHQ